MPQRNSKPCPLCGQKMHRQSKMCRKCFLLRRSQPQNYVNRICPVCDKTFRIHEVHIKRGQGIYCSQSCARSGSPTRKKTSIMLSCHVCGKEFRKHQSEINKNVGDLHFCSSDCWYEHNQRENHYGWEGGQNERMSPEARIWRKAVIERDKYYCRNCHSQDRLEAHHIKRFATHPDIRWEVSNGITLCYSCHKAITNNEEEFEEVLGFVAGLHLEVWNDPNETF